MMLPLIRVLAEVAMQHDIPIDLLRAPSRIGGMRAFEARCHAAKRLRFERGLSLNKIGALLGGRCHTTILYMVRDEFRQRKLAMNRVRAARVRLPKPKGLWSNRDTSNNWRYRDRQTGR